jgi:hypothetical protein
MEKLIYDIIPRNQHSNPKGFRLLVKLNSAFEALVISISQFSRTSPRRELGAGAIQLPVEAHYQNQFYRACYRILKKKVFLTPEWSGGILKGRIDFYLRAMKWAIEHSGLRHY